MAPCAPPPLAMPSGAGTLRVNKALGGGGGKPLITNNACPQPFVSAERSGATGYASDDNSVKISTDLSICDLFSLFQEGLNWVLKELKK